MTVGQAMAVAEQRLEAAGVPTPRVDAELLLRHVTGWSRTRLVFDADAAVPAAARDQLETLLRRRESREPLQLILGTVGFRYIELEVRAGVFIPRPETEVLAGEAIARVPAGGVVVEPCTGTGAIACSIAFESAAATVVATDMSAAAVDLARVNAQRVGADVTVLAGDLLAPVDQALQGRVDVLVSNPPYLTPQDVAGGEPEVTDWDPHDALVSGPTGHEVTDRLIGDARTWLGSGGWLLLEVDSTRAADTAQRAEDAGLVEAAVLADLTGADRIVAARRA